MPVSFRANEANEASEASEASEANEWHFAVGSVLERVSDDAKFVVTAHALHGVLGHAVYVLAGRASPHLNWAMSADSVHDCYRLVDTPHYSIQRLTPTTWSVAHPAPGGSGLRHVVATCNTLLEAERHAVTLELRRAGVK